MCPRLVFPVPGANTRKGVSSALMLEADNTYRPIAATRGPSSSLVAATHCISVVRLIVCMSEDLALAVEGQMEPELPSQHQRQ